MANGLVQGKTMEVPSGKLFIEWPERNKKALKFWLSSLPPYHTSWRGLVRKAKRRSRIERDYEEMKGEAGLDHFRGRSWQGWHHHVILAYALLILEGIGNIKRTSGLTLPAVSQLTEKSLMLYPGIFQICKNIIFLDDA
jgi:SRSO17 transposase